MGEHHVVGRQCIVPPYMVEAIELRGTREQRAMAQSLHAEAERFRAMRQEQAPARGLAGHVEAQPVSETENEVYDAESGSTLPGVLVRGGDAEPTDDEIANQTYDATDHTIRFLREVFKRESLDGAAMRLISTVHYERNYNNAFWSGQQMVYGDGDGVIFKPLSGSLSVVAHELAHGVVQHSGGLVYSDQPGALNEHVADVFGCLATQYTRGQDAAEADWLIGDGILGDGISGVALRSMRAPGTAYDDDLLGTDPQPFHMDGYVVTSSDHGGVHYNSGIPNHAFYLLAQLLGGRAWEKAGHIWYDALLGIRNPHAQFGDWADKTVEVATGQFGSGSLEATLTRRAWKLVGVDL